MTKAAGLPETLRPGGLPAAFMTMISRQIADVAFTVNDDELLDLVLATEAAPNLFDRNRVGNSAAMEINDEILRLLSRTLELDGDGVLLERTSLNELQFPKELQPWTVASINTCCSSPQ